uniref:Uncharacterized protein n=1 Tax=Nicotiana tabacum TaxID=4097 RepID=A0A1S3ZHN6_TOBAC|nr:PREDICTED: uncharacterized protein LOC107786776 [Nicotiana tabacum]
MVTEPPFGPVIDTVTIGDDEEAREFDLVDNVNSHFRAPISLPGTAGLSTRSLPSLVGEHPTNKTAFDAAASHSLTPSASSLSSPTPATVTSLPSSSSFSPAIATSSPPAVPNHEEERLGKYSGISGECLLNNAMHNATVRLIHEKEEITSARDQLLAEQEQHVARLSELDAKVAEAVVLEARLWQSEQEVVTLSQEIDPLRVRFDETRAKWVEVHNAVHSAIEHEASFAERVINLEAALNSKIEKLAATGEKHALLEEKYRKTI